MKKQTEKENITETKTIFVKCKLTSTQIEEVAEKENMSARQMTILRMLSASMNQKLQIHMYYHKLEENQYLCAVTLTDELDKWLEKLQKEEEIEKEYMLERLADRALLSAYDLLISHIETDNKVFQSISFLSDEGEFQKMPDYVKMLSANEIQLNRAGMLTPLKSVVFILKFSDQKSKTREQNTKEQNTKEKNCKHVDSKLNICKNCNNINCSYRKSE